MDVEKLFDIMFSSLFGPYFDDSMIDLNIMEVVEVYNPDSLKIVPFESESVKKLTNFGKNCDFASLSGGFHDVHSAGIDGNTISFFKKEGKAYLSLYICNSCLKTLTLGNLLRRLIDFQDVLIENKII